ncbi:hypothetical protein EV188_1011074 [Actinomycetospora succinea]|uniref:LppP/LprE lipoprotein n=1 Tax=Actinomycetospora succinea TaxID=663603 RepID=A0A4R6VPI6_9PSEU|nr:hypothetical protein [Actinomycetospora succinea]TDQ65822.1 hypothetical protein EV188_1011074 [Actinomycetospora succinea]
MRRPPALPPTLRLGLLAAAVLLAAGCGQSDPPEPAGTPSAPPMIPTGAPPPSNRPVPAEPDPLTAAPPAGATALPTGRVDASALPAGLPTLVWTRGDAVVGVYGRAGGCTDARLTVVEQDTERVVLRVEQFSTGPGPCTRELVYPPLEATLAAPLGERPVVLTGAVP